MVNAHMTTNAQGDERFRLIVLVTMMNQQSRAGVAGATAEMVAFHHLFTQSAEETYGMMTPVITGTAAATSFQFDSATARTKKS
jgi:hypothetical protein